MVREIGPRKIVEEGLGGVVKVEVSETVMHGSYGIGTSRRIRWALYVQGEDRLRPGLFRTQRDATAFLLQLEV